MGPIMCHQILVNTTTAVYVLIACHVSAVDTLLLLAGIHLQEEAIQTKYGLTVKRRFAYAMMCVLLLHVSCTKINIHAAVVDDRFLKILLSRIQMQS